MDQQILRPPSLLEEDVAKVFASSATDLGLAATCRGIKGSAARRCPRDSALLGEAGTIANQCRFH